MKRWLKRIGVGALVALGVVLALILGAWLYFSTAPGERFLRRVALEEGNKALPGTLKLEGLDVQSGAFVLTGLVLEDPEGNVVARIPRVEVTLDLVGLAAGRVDIRRARIEDPELNLVLDERGLNLMRALQAEQEEEKPAGKSSLRVKVRHLVLEGGTVDLKQSTLADVAPHVRIEDLEIADALSLNLLRERLEADLQLKGTMTHPVEGPVSLKADVSRSKDEIEGKAALEIAGLVLDVEGSREGTEAASLELKEWKVPAATARALFPAWPLTADATASGTLEQEGNLARVDLSLAAGGATATVQGGVDVARLRAEDLEVTARGVDLSKLVPNGPGSDISLTLTATGGGTSLEDLDAQVALEVPRARLEAQTVGPIALRASAKDGRFELSRLEVQVPGAHLTARGGGTLSGVTVKGNLDATDLALFGRTLGRVADPDGLPLEGGGALAFEVKGPPRHPSVWAKGAFGRLRYGEMRVEDLTLEGTLPDVRRPLDVDAALTAGVFQAGERRFRDVQAEVATRGRALTADVTASGFASVGLHLEGTLDEDRQGLALAELALRYPEATWTLQRPTHVSFGNGQVRAETLTLESGRQRITVEGGVRGARVSAWAQLENVALATLPSAAVPESLNLGGEVDARVTVEGTTRRPEAAAQVTWRDGTLATLEDLGLELDATWKADRAEGELRARAFGAAVSGRFSVPVMEIFEPKGSEVAIDLAVEPTDLRPLFAALEVDPNLTGRAAATIHVSGKSDAPRVRVTVDSDGLQHQAGPAGDLDLIVESHAETGQLSVRLDLDTMGSQGYLLIQTPFVPRQFLDQPVTDDLFLTTEVSYRGAFRDVPVAAFGAWGLVSTELGGRASLTLEGQGTVLRPRGKAHLALKGTSAPGVKPFDAFATLDAGAETVAVTLTALRGQQRLLDLGGQLATSLGALLSRDDLDDVAVGLEGEWGPVRLSELRALTATDPVDEDGSGEPDGVLAGQVKVEGTPRDPTATVDLTVDKLGVGQTALGKVELGYRYQDALSVLHAALTSAKGGSLIADGKLTLDLSAPALREGVAWRRAPVEARVESRRFDPAFLSNLSRLVREVSGPLEATASLNGTLGAPRLRGQVEWKEGRLALMGYGTYRNIHLLLKGANEAITLEDLSVEAGAGKLRLTARADRREDGFSLKGQGTLEDFPIVYDDQLEAIASTRFTLQGEATADRVLIRDLALPEAHVELPEVRRKDLQDLDRPEDIVLVRSGEPLYRRRKGRGGPPEGTGAGGEAGEGEGGRRYTILVNAPRNVWIRGTDVNAEIGLSEGFRIEVADRVLLFGEVRVLRGRVDVLGRRFDVLEDSLVRFAGPAAVPYINVTAEHVNEREAVTVYTTIRGQGADVKLNVSSTPALSESEIYTLLATGRRTLKRGSGTSMTGEEAASVAGAYFASQAKQVLATKVPVDVLSFEAGSSGLADASVEAGTYLTDKIYIGSILKLGADPEEHENTAGVRLEYQITPRWSFELEYGTSQRGGADLIWSRDY